VWGTSCDGRDECAGNSVWGTSAEDEQDNIVWGTSCETLTPTCADVVWSVPGASRQPKAPWRRRHARLE
jgi:hypothetical protein